MKLLHLLAIIGVLTAQVAARGCGQPAFTTDATKQEFKCTDNQCTLFKDGYCVRGYDPGHPCAVDAECYTGKCKDGVCNKDGCGDIPSAKCAVEKSKDSLGYLFAAISVVFFGSNFVPVKTHETGNGIFFQWILCSGIMVCGIVVQLIRGSPAFHPYAMVGGALWCTGNIMVVPIIKTIGLSLGICLWGAFNMLAGWSSGKFGLFGLEKESVSDPHLNIAGVCIAVLSVFSFASIEPSLSAPEKHEATSQYGTTVADSEANREESEVESDVLSKKKRRWVGGGTVPPAPLPYVAHSGALLQSETASTGIGDGGSESSVIQTVADALAGDTNDDEFRKMLGPMCKPLGVILSIISGVLYGVNFDPPRHMQDYAGRLSMEHDTLYSSNGIDYVFAHFCGIFLTSTFYMMLYSFVKQWTPRFNAQVVYPKIILPAFVSGVMWAIADISWFVANTKLGLITSFPIITTGPGLISAFWGVIVFKEISGRANLIKLVVAFALLGAAVIMIALSN